MLANVPPSVGPRTCTWQRQRGLVPGARGKRSLGLCSPSTSRSKIHDVWRSHQCSIGIQTTKVTQQLKHLACLCLRIGNRTRVLHVFGSSSFVFFFQSRIQRLYVFLWMSHTLIMGVFFGGWYSSVHWGGGAWTTTFVVGCRQRWCSLWHDEICVIMGGWGGCGGDNNNRCCLQTKIMFFVTWWNQCYYGWGEEGVGVGQWWSRLLLVANTEAGGLFCKTCLW